VGAAVTTTPTGQAGPLLSAVLVYCAEHPYADGDLEPGVLTFQQTMVGTERVVNVLGDVPDVMEAATELLDAADPQLVSFERGLLVLNVVPLLLYRPLYVGRRADTVVFRRVCATCYDSRKVPDWSRGLDPVYGEPKGKPCPDCLE
jgi:hypothetical protein